MALSSEPRWDVAKRTAFLSSVRLFERLPPPVLREAAARFRVKRVSRAQYLFLEGEPAQALHILAAGRVKVIRETEEGREVILRVIGPGEIFGGAGGWGEATYPATAVVLEPGVVLQMPSAQFAELITAHPEFALAVVGELGARLREAEARIRDLQTERVERRIARVLLRLASKTGKKTSAGVELGLPLTRQDLAELAGTTLSTASRTLSAWDARGIIVAGRERVVIREPHALVAIAEEFPPPHRAPDHP